MDRHLQQHVDRDGYNDDETNIQVLSRRAFRRLMYHSEPADIERSHSRVKGDIPEGDVVPEGLVSRSDICALLNRVPRDFWCFFGQILIFP